MGKGLNWVFAKILLVRILVYCVYPKGQWGPIFVTEERGDIMKKQEKKSVKKEMEALGKALDKFALLANEVVVTKINRYKLENDGYEIWAEVEDGRLTLETYDLRDYFKFPHSEPELVRAIGKMFIKAAELARKGGE